MIDTALIGKQLQIFDVVFSVLIYIFSMIVCSFSEWASSFTEAKMKKDLAINLNDILIEKLSNIEYACFENNTQNLINKVSDALDESFYTFFEQIVAVISKVISIMGFMVFFFSYSFTLGSILTSMVILSIVFCFKGAKLRVFINKKFTQSERTLKYLMEILKDKNSLCELRVFGSENYITTKMTKLFKKIFNDKKLIVKKEKQYSMYYSISLVICEIFSFFITINLYLNKFITLGFFITTFSAIKSIVELSYSLSAQFSVVSQISFSKVHDLEDFLKLPEIEKTNYIFSLSKIPSDKLIIEFKDVYFKYPNTEKLILNGINFKISGTDKIAIVGENGSGKSTIIKLLLGLYRPNKGHILINGYDINTISRKDLHYLFSVIFQDFSRFMFSVKDNIALGDIEKCDNTDEIIKMAKKYQIFDVSPLGVDTILGNINENGVDISLGQWQKIALARADYNDSKFIILDEPVASLDPKSEIEIYRFFANTIEKKGFIIVSHRMASTRIASKILVMQNGTISEEGTHDELMANRKYYYNAFNAQRYWYGGSELIL